MITEINEKRLLKTFYKLIVEVECGKHFDFSNPHHDEWLRRRIARHYYSGAKFYALYEADKPVGFAGLLTDEWLEGVSISGQKTELLDIGILPEFSNKGYGKKLLDYAEEKSRLSGAYCMYISTYAKDTTAISFYLKNGFVQVAVLPDVNGPGDAGNAYLRKIVRR
jgi:ribosomal protein S18 acetylase RimI-like enzyme